MPVAIGFALIAPFIAAAGAAVGVGADYVEFRNQANEAYNSRHPERANDTPQQRADDLERDAFRHSYTSARYTQKYGEEMAHWLGDLNEAVNDQYGQGPREMDYFNNHKGREAANEVDSTAEFDEVDEDLADYLDSLLENELRTTEDPNVPYPEDYVRDEAVPEDGFIDDLIDAIKNGGGNVADFFKGLWDFKDGNQGSGNGNGGLNPNADGAQGNSGSSPDMCMPLFPTGGLPQPKSPLVIDANFDNEISISALGDTTTYFDLNGDGQAELTAWVANGDGLLVRDLNSNGRIDDIAELFGNNDGSEDGFSVLRELDSNNDGRISSDDSAWSELLVWVDSNSDGFTQDGELHSMDEMGIVSISTQATLVDADNNGNQITHVASFENTEGTEFSVADVWFQTNGAMTRNTEDYVFDMRMAYLPTLRGFGSMKDLHIAASIDNGDVDTVMSLVISVVDEIKTLGDLASIFEDWSSIESKVDDLLLKWAGVDSISSSSRGEHVDAQHLEFYEAFSAIPFLQYNQPNPLVEAGAQVESIYSYIKTFYTSQFVAQVIGAELFDAQPIYSLSNGSMFGEMDLSQDALNDFSAVAELSSNPVEAWVRFASFLGYTKGLSNLSSAEIIMLDTAVVATNEPSLTDWADVVNTMNASLGPIILDSGDFPNIEVIYDYAVSGTSGANTITAANNDSHLLRGLDGDDTLNGLDGSDRLEGGSGNDVMSGGLGDDFLLGGAGDDTFMWHAGNDTFEENMASAGFDEVKVSALSGLTSSDVTDMFRTGNNLVVQLTGGSFLTFENQFGSTFSRIEKLTFLDDNSFFDLTSLSDLNYYGSAGNDTISASSAVANDKIYGYGGNDRLFGTEDDGDHLFGGAGSDKLVGDDGDDELDGGSGDDYLYGDYYGGSVQGDDIFYVSTGRDVIFDDVGNDTIIFRPGLDINLVDVDIYRGGSYLYIEWGDGNITYVEDHFGQPYFFDETSNRVEQIVFSDTTSLDLTTLQYETRGSVFDDELLYGIGYDAFDQNDIIYGYAGNDGINGGVGDDMLYGGAGDDVYFISDDEDTIIEEGSDVDILKNYASFDYFGDYINPYDTHQFFAYADGDDLVVGFEGTSSLTTIQDQLISTKVEYMEFTDYFINNGNDQYRLDLANYADWTFGTNNALSGDTITGNFSYVNPTMNHDVIFAYDGDDTIDATDGLNYVFAGAGDDTVIGGTGTDNIYGGDGEDDISGGDESDDLYGQNGDDLIDGGDGDDYIHAGYGADTIYGGGGNDHIITGTLGYYEEPILTPSDDDVNTVYGGAGDDLIYGARGNDILNGDEDSDSIFGANGNDTINGGDGNDFIDGGSGVDSVDGGDGVDTIAFESFAGFQEDNLDNGVTVNLYTGIISDDGYGNIETIANIESVYGTSYVDTITGDDNDNWIMGGFGDDILDGGNGNDTYALLNGWEAVINLELGTVTEGGILTDTILNFENVEASEEADVIIGTDGTNILNGFGGDDQLYGADGNDTLIGFTGSDYLEGGEGNDEYRYVLADGIEYPGDDHDTIDDVDGDDRITLFNASMFNLDFDHVGDDLVVNLDTEYTGSITIRDFYVSGDSIECIYFDGDSSGYFNLLTMTWVGWNTAPVIASNGGGSTASLDVTEGETSVTTVFATDIDVGTALSYSISGGDDSAKFSINSSTGALSFLIAPDYSNPDDDNLDNVYEVEVSVSDGTLTDTQAISVNVIDLSLINGSSSGETINGTADADTINGLGGNDTINAGNGNDIINGGAGDDVINGGSGNDTVVYSDATSAVMAHITYLYGSGGGGEDTLNSIENVIGSAYGDTIWGSSVANILNGGAGGDDMYAYGGVDALYGGAGNDILDGGAGDDLLDGGSDIDVAYYYYAAAAVNVDLVLGMASGGDGNDILVSIEDILGSNYDDVLRGNASANMIIGGDGDDVIIGGPGNDTLYGGGGTDTLSFADAVSAVTVDMSTSSVTGGDGTDTISEFEKIIGSSFNDTITGSWQNNSFNGGAGDDIFVGSSGDDELFGGYGSDTVTYSSLYDAAEIDLSQNYASIDTKTDTLDNIENIIGTTQNDTITGDGASNILDGWQGHDTVDGLGGNDHLKGHTGNDTVYGGDGNDTLEGGIGSDTLHGGDGNDRAFYSVASTNFIIFRDHADYITVKDMGNTNDAFGYGGDKVYNDVESVVFNDTTLTLSEFTFEIGGEAWGSLTVTLINTGQTYNGTSARDIVYAGTSNDDLYGHLGDDDLYGNSGTDLLDGGSGDDLLEGGAGNDVISGGAGDDEIDGGSDTDTVSYSSSLTAVNVDLDAGTASGEGSDTLANIENVVGSDYGDIITGDNSGNTLEGGDGNDILDGGLDDDDIDGEGGNDTVTYAAATGAITANLGGSFATGAMGNDTLTSIENIIGSAYADTLSGTTGSNTITAGAGNDTIYASWGNDTIYGGAGDDYIGSDLGDDHIDGGADIDSVDYWSAASSISVNLSTGVVSGAEGNDTLANIENISAGEYADTLIGDSGDNLLNGNGGNDTIQGGAGNDALSGGDGTDMLSYSSASSYVTVSLSAGTATGGAGTDTLTGFENITGSSYNDDLTGNWQDNVIYGGDGNDIITGLGGIDTLNGGDGNDTFVSATEDDVIDGGNGIDTLNYVADYAVTVDISAGTTVGSSGDHTFTGIENVKGSIYGDSITGNNSANTLRGHSGNDSLYGSGGDDFLYGEAGTDTLNGGTGADTFVFESASAFSNVDTISDFSTTDDDAINLIDVLSLYDPMNDLITDFVQMTTSGSDSLLSVDRDGAGSTYSMTQIATLTGITGLTDEAALVTNGNLIVA